MLQTAQSGTWGTWYAQGKVAFIATTIIAKTNVIYTKTQKANFQISQFPYNYFF